MAETAGTTSIYALSCPDSGQVMYIGKANKPEHRLKGHLRDCRRRKTNLYRWLNKLLAEGKQPKLTIIETIAFEAWEDRERHWIAHYRSLGPLLNMADGGDQPSCPIEVRRANGMKQLRILRGIDPAPPSKDTRELLIRDTYEWALGFARSRGHAENYHKTAIRMREYAKTDPKNFKRWANVPLEMLADA